MTAPAPGDPGFRDLVLYDAGGAERAALIRLFNLLSESAALGLVMASSRSGLGTAPPVGPPLAGESLYYQALRVWSYFDWELARRLREGAGRGALPAALAVLIGRFPAPFLDRFADPRIPLVDKLERALAALLPDLRPFAFRRLRADDFAFLGAAPGSGGAPDPGARRFRRRGRQVAYAAPIRDQLWAGTAGKLAGIAARTYTADATDPRDKLETMVGAFAPLATDLAAELDADRPERCHTRLTLYLPPFHTLHADDVDDPSGWYLERGLPRISLPRPVQIRAAELTHLAYLSEADRRREQAISIEVRRDYAADGVVTVTTRFGRLFADATEELLGLDASDHRDGLYIGFRPRLPAAEQDSAAVRAAKEAFHRVLGGFEVDARISELTLDLHRTAAGDPDGAAEVMRPRFALDRSRISFRAHRRTAGPAERIALEAAGFTCEPPDPASGLAHCHRDFWTWDRFAEFLAGHDLGGGAGGLLAHGRERLLEQLVGFATRAVIDRSIPSIEDAIDDEIARVVGDHLDRYARAKRILTERLHDGLF